MKKKKALIIGSTGLIGKELLHLLLEEEAYEKVYAVVRRPVHTQHPKLAEHVVDFEHLQADEEFFEADDVFCCLGTTIKIAGSRSAMRKVDVEYPVKVARLAKEKGSTHYLVVSAGGANPKSPFAYSRMKGDLEEQLKSLLYETLSIFHPSLLLGEREEHRTMEGLANKAVRTIEKIKKSPISSGLAIEGKTVALAMNRIAQENEKGVHVYSSKQIGEIAAKL